ncbi:Pectinesterase inhibitor [Melia azedarach]|uniref:Pectinesterase inhibitor n=1 Tax=Melia azedarach TaxID=155640 RepID=A0ACC1YUE7_MELAZ|nr:Pectinesterase inhibitor [Melia azedarach]
MKPNFCSFSCLLLLFFTFHAITAHNIVRETCKKCAQSDPNLSYNFCLTSLQAVQSSHCANLRELGIISMKLTRQNLTNTKSFIKELLKNKKLDPFTKGCLNDCFELYSDAIPTLKQTLKDYKSKHYEDANIGVSSVLDACTTCEDGFKEKQDAVSPLSKRNNDTFQLSAIALSIINMLNLH